MLIVIIMMMIILGLNHKKLVVVKNHCHDQFILINTIAITHAQKIH